MTSWLKALGLCLAASLLLTACGPNEADQRAAFIGFLQTDVLSKKGVRVPQLDEEKRKAFGDYAAQYDVVMRFHDRMNASVAAPMKQIVAGAAPTTIQEVVARKADFATVRAGMAKLREALDQAVATADREKAALKQAPDLAAVYAQAYDKLVTQPAAVFREIFPATDDAFASLAAFGDLVDSARSAIKINGSQIEVSDPALRAKVQAAMTAMNDKRMAINAAQEKLRRSLYGE